MIQEQKPKKPTRKKSKPSAMTRPPRKNKKKKKQPLQPVKVQQQPPYPWHQPVQKQHQQPQPHQQQVQQQPQITVKKTGLFEKSKTAVQCKTKTSNSPKFVQPQQKQHQQQKQQKQKKQQKQQQRQVQQEEERLILGSPLENIMAFYKKTSKTDGSRMLLKSQPTITVPVNHYISDNTKMFQFLPVADETYRYHNQPHQLLNHEIFTVCENSSAYESSEDTGVGGLSETELMGAPDGIGRCC